MNEENSSLGERLQYARKKRGYTQDFLAESIGVSRGVIYNIEKNKNEPQAIVINAICRTLRISRDWLLLGAGEMDYIEDSSRSVKILTELYEVAKELSENEQLYLLDVVKALKQRIKGEGETQ